MLHKKNIYFLFAFIILLAAFYLYNPFAFYFQSDDFVHIQWSREGIIFQDNSFRPVCDISIMLDYFLFGKNAWGYHCSNLILHFIASVLTGYLCGIFIEKFFYKNAQTRITSITCGILFFIYASHSEAVFWILGRSAILGTIFSLLFIIGFLQKNKSLKFILLYILSWILALLSYESSWVLPAFVLLYTFLLNEKNKWQHCVVVLIIFIAYLFARYFFIRQVLGNYEGDYLFSGQWKTLIQHFLLLIIRSFLPWYKQNVVSFFGLIVLFIFLVMLFFSLQKMIQKKAGFIFILFVVSLAPYISLGIDTNGVEGERFLYFPTVFLCIFIMLVIHFSTIKNLYKKIWLLLCCLLQLLILQENSKNQQFAGDLVRKILHEISAVDVSKKIIVKDLPQCQYGALIFRDGLPEATGWLIHPKLGKNIVIVSLRSEVLPLEQNYKVQYLKVESNDTVLFKFSDSVLLVSMSDISR